MIKKELATASWRIGWDTFSDFQINHLSMHFESRGRWLIVLSATLPRTIPSGGR
jgi:hypothetical protein